jgi:serine/threonine-protein kinase PRP4
MLLLMMELKGRFNTKMIKKAKFGDVYFDEMGSFDSVERDRVTNTVRILLSHLYRSDSLLAVRMLFGRSTYPSRPEICEHG